MARKTPTLNQGKKQGEKEKGDGNVATEAFQARLTIQWGSGCPRILHTMLDLPNAIVTPNERLNSKFDHLGRDKQI